MDEKDVIRQGMRAAFRQAAEDQCAKEPWAVQTTRYIKFGHVHERFQAEADRNSDNPLLHDANLYAAETAREIYRQQASRMIDPARAEALATAEPWSDQTSPEHVIGQSTFGFVSEKFRNAGKLYPEGSAERAAHDAAYYKSAAVYHQQMKQMALAYVPGKSRKVLEPGVFTTLWLGAHAIERNRVYDETYLHTRVMSLIEIMGEVYAHENPTGGPNRGNPAGMDKMIVRFK